MDVSRDKKDDEDSKRARRSALRDSNSSNHQPSKGNLDSSLKRHMAFIKRLKTSLAAENRDVLVKEIDGLTLEKYVEEIVNGVIEGLARCKTDKDVWSATEIISSLHRRLGSSFTPKLISLLLQALAPPPRNAPAAASPEIQERDTTTRLTKQRPILRVSAELALVGIIPEGGKWVMSVLKELLAHDPSLSSVPLLITFLKAYGKPFLGLGVEGEDAIDEKEELIEKEIRERFRRMCEGYFDGVAKLLVKEHHRLQDLDRRNHEAYIRSGEIFEDRAQAYEKQTKGYEKLLGHTQTLSELLGMSMPALPKARDEGMSIGVVNGERERERDEIILGRGSPWEDEEERKFYEDIRNLKDWVPRGFLNIPEETDGDALAADLKETTPELEKEEADIERLTADEEVDEETEDGGDSRPSTPTKDKETEAEAIAPGPSQVLTALLAKLPDATSRDLIDEVAVEFMFLNSKAARKRLVKYLMTSSKGRSDLVPYYARLVATVGKYEPDVVKEVMKELEDEFRWLQKKRKGKEMRDLRGKNTHWFSTLTKFRLVPSHVILHIVKVFLDDLAGPNIESLASLLEGCGRFLLRSPETGEKMGSMLELMKRKQSIQNLDQRQALLLENAYYQCNPPERGPVEHKIRSPTEQFIRHLLCDVLSRKTLDNVLKLLRKLHWDEAHTYHVLYKMFTKPWKVAYSSITLLAMLAYDLQRHHSKFVVDIVDQVLENVRVGMEENVYKNNQKRVATLRYLGELYIYRLVNSRVVFDTLWSLVTFGHNEGRPLPGQVSPIDAPDDFFRIRLICTLLDSCGMCFDRGSHMRKLDRFLTFFQLYILTKDDLPMDIDFMITDTLEQLRPKLVIFKTFEEAAAVVDEMFESTKVEADESGDESGDDEERELAGDANDDAKTVDDQASVRPDSPDHLVVLDAKDSGPSIDEVADFDKELSKMLSDAAADAKKVDRKAALSAWDTGVTTTGNVARRKKDTDRGEPETPTNVMRFAVLTKKSNKNATRELEIPTTSTLVAQTLSAQIQSKQEQEQLKRLVLDYEQREELAEKKAFESSMRSQGIRVRYGT